MAIVLNTYDLVIVSRSSPSGHFGDPAGESPAERAFWNTTITAPVMHLGGYVLRANRLGFTSGNDMPDTTSTVTLQALVPNHPVFSGIPLDGGNLMVNSFAGATSFNSITQRGISINSSPLAGGGTLIAAIGAATTVDNAAIRGSGMVIAEWAAGSTLQLGDVLGGRRMVFLTGSRENAGLTSDGAGIFDLSADGSTMFLNAANYMVVPEPSTYALLGLGALALLMRWRKS